MKYTKEEIEFLIKNYSKYGGKYCQPFLKGRSVDAINAAASRLGLKVSDKQVHPDLQPVSISRFSNLDANVAYFLGLLWADGHVYHYLSKNGINNWRISLEIQEEDAIKISDLMGNIGKWSIQKRKRKDTWKTTWNFVTNNKDLYQFLFDNNYTTKSVDEPSKILKVLPKELHLFFWRGVTDGDGSLGLSGEGAYFEISSTYDYKYTELEKFLGTLGVKGGVYKQISKKNHRSSVYKIYGKKILKLEPLFEIFGLERKTNKFKIIKQKYEN